jgi:hypothetical protein
LLRFSNLVSMAAALALKDLALILLSLIAETLTLPSRPRLRGRGLVSDASGSFCRWFGFERTLLSCAIAVGSPRLNRPRLNRPRLNEV